MCVCERASEAINMGIRVKTTHTSGDIVNSSSNSSGGGGLSLSVCPHVPTQLHCEDSISMFYFDIFTSMFFLCFYAVSLCSVMQV